MNRSTLFLPLAAVVLAGCGGSVKSTLDLPSQHTTVTADGWALSLLRYSPVRADAERLPVVLCHGLSYNDTFWDLSHEVSLARYLQSAGYDVWVPSLRGRAGPPSRR